jgi:predicted secreted Zn-dependent protease
MIKQISMLMMFMAISTSSSAFAVDDNLKVASIDKEHVGKSKGPLLPSVTEKYEYYEIRGGCEKDLHGQLCRNGFVWDDGKKYDSATNWDVKWDYGYDRTSQACSAESFKVTVEVVFHFPKWTRTNDAPPKLVEKWDAYMKNLSLHENGHRDLVVEAATGLSRSVALLPPASTCAELDREVRALCRERMQLLASDQNEYDAATDHGVSQGAVFP